MMAFFIIPCFSELNKIYNKKISKYLKNEKHIIANIKAFNKVYIVF